MIYSIANVSLIFLLFIIILQQTGRLLAKEQKRSTNSEPSYPWTFDNDLFGGIKFVFFVFIKRHNDINSEFKLKQFINLKGLDKFVNNLHFDLF